MAVANNYGLLKRYRPSCLSLSHLTLNSSLANIVNPPVINPNEQLVLFKLTIRNLLHGYCYFSMDKREFTDYLHEQEVILSDGAPFTVYEVEEES